MKRPANVISIGKAQLMALKEKERIYIDCRKRFNLVMIK